MSQPIPDRLVSSPARHVARLVLGAFLTFAGFSHLTFARNAFHAQVPTWLPLGADFVIVVSGVVEILLGAGLVVLTRWRARIGWVVALFFVLIFPGNVSQFVTHTTTRPLLASTRTLPAQSDCFFSRCWWCGHCGAPVHGRRAGALEPEVVGEISSGAPIVASPSAVT